MSERLQEPAKSISDTDWAERRRQSNVTQQHLDRFVLNFLVTEVCLLAASICAASALWLTVLACHG